MVTDYKRNSLNSFVVSRVSRLKDSTSSTNSEVADERVCIQTITNNCDLLIQIVFILWKKWSHYFINHTEIMNPEKLHSEILQYIKKENNVITIFVMYIFRRGGVADGTDPRNSENDEGVERVCRRSVVEYGTDIILSDVNKGEEVPRTNELLGFCFVEMKESKFLTWITPSLTYLYIIDSILSTNLQNSFLEYVTSFYKTLYLWTFSYEEIPIYEKYGFHTISITSGETSDVILMKKM